MKSLSRSGAVAAAVIAAAGAVFAAHAQPESVGGFDRSVRDSGPLYPDSMDQTRTYGRPDPGWRWNDPLDQTWYTEDPRIQRSGVRDDDIYGTGDDWFDDDDDDWFDDDDDGWSWFDDDDDRASVRRDRGIDDGDRYQDVPGHYPQGTYGIWSDYSGHEGGRDTFAGADEDWFDVDDRAQRDASWEAQPRQEWRSEFDPRQGPGSAELLRLRPEQETGSILTDEFGRPVGRTGVRGMEQDVYGIDRDYLELERDAMRRRSGVYDTGAAGRRPGEQGLYGIWGDYGAPSGSDFTTDRDFDAWYDEHR